MVRKAKIATGRELSEKKLVFYRAQLGNNGLVRIASSTNRGTHRHMELFTDGQNVTVAHTRTETNPVTGVALRVVNKALEYTSDGKLKTKKIVSVTAVPPRMRTKVKSYNPPGRFIGKMVRPKKRTIIS